MSSRSRQTEDDPSTIPFQPQPIPILYQKCRLNGVTALTRLWRPGDAARCGLCDVCTATRDVCTIMTEEDVQDGGAALYSSLGLDFGDEAIWVEARAPLGLTF